MKQWIDNDRTFRVMKNTINHLFKKYFEIVAFSLGLLLLAFMNPETAVGAGLCPIENLGFTYCPGDGLGHSISYTFQGDISNALQSNILGPLAIVILGGRISFLLKRNWFNKK